MTDQHNAIQTTEKPKARTEFDAWLKRVKNAPLYWNQSDAMLAAFVAGHAVALSKLPAPVTDLRPHLEWALRRIGTSLDTGDKYEAAQAALDAARAAPQVSASNFAKLQSAYVGACDQLGELLASVPRAGQSQHPDDIAVDSFAVAMKAKLAKKRAEGRGGWSDKSQCTAEFLSQLLRGHVDKGDPVDVGKLAMMLHQRGEAIAPAEDDGRDTAPLAVERAPEDPSGYVAVKRSAVEWLKDKFPALTIKAGLCERIGGRLYTITRLMRDHDSALASAPVADERELMALADAVVAQWQRDDKMPQMAWGFREFLVAGMQALIDSNRMPHGSDALVGTLARLAYYYAVELESATRNADSDRLEGIARRVTARLRGEIRAALASGTVGGNADEPMEYERGFAAGWDQCVASAPVTGEPFMYGIMGPDGKAHFEEFCVSGDRSELQAEVVDHLNRDNPEDGPYSVVALFRDAAPQASAERLVRYCPGCGSVGPVEGKYHDCCPDGGEARMVPAPLAEKCRDTFKIAVKLLCADAAANEAMANQVPTVTEEYTLRAMARNYTDRHSWNKLDGKIITAAADEIRALRAALAAGAQSSEKGDAHG